MYIGFVGTSHLKEQVNLSVSCQISDSTTYLTSNSGSKFEPACYRPKLLNENNAIKLSKNTAKFEHCSMGSSNGIACQ